MIGLILEQSFVELIMYRPVKREGYLQGFSEKIKSLKKRFFFSARKNDAKKEASDDLKDDPNELYTNFIVPFIKKEFSLIGYDIFDPKYKISGFLWFIIVDVQLYLVINIIDIWLIWGSTVQDIAFCFVTWMLGWTGFILSINMVTKKLHFCKLQKMVYDFGANLDKKSEPEETKKYLEHCETCKKFVILTGCFCVTGGIVCNCYPIVVYFATGEAILPYGFFIPGTSMTENPGYIINYTYQIFQCYCTILGTMNGVFHSYLFFASSAFFQMDNLIIKMHKLDREIVEKPHKEGHEAQLKKIIKLHQKFQSYLAMINDTYNQLFFLDILMYTAMNIVGLFVLVDTRWYVGYYLLFVVLGLIFMPCAIGTAIEIKNDAMIDEIYGLSWYLLVPKERKLFKLFLFGAQKTEMPTCGGFLPLNVNTFRMIYSKIYSFLMFLIDTSKEKKN